MHALQVYAAWLQCSAVSCASHSWATSFEFGWSLCTALHGRLPTCCGARLSGQCKGWEGAGQCSAVCQAAMQRLGQSSLTFTATAPIIQIQHHFHACVLLQQDGQEDHSKCPGRPLVQHNPSGRPYAAQAAHEPCNRFLSVHATCVLCLCLHRCSMMRERSWL